MRIKYLAVPHVVAQPSDNSCNDAKEDLVIGSSLVAHDSEIHCNPNDEFV